MHKQRQSKLNAFELWDSLKLQRTQFFAFSMLYTGLVVVIRLVALVGFGVAFKVGITGVLFVLSSIATCVPLIRNNLVLSSIGAVMWTLVCVGFVLGIVFVANGHSNPIATFLGVKAQDHTALLSIALRIQPIPFVMVVFFFAIGLPVRVCVVPSAVLFVAFGVMMAVIRQQTNDFSVSDVVAEVLANIFNGATLLYFGWTAENRQQETRKNITLVQQTVRQWVAEKESDRLTRTRIVSYIFHEVRNPLNNILLASDLLTTQIQAMQQKPADQQQPYSIEEIKEMHEMLHIISSAAASACHVLNDALSLQKLETGSFEFVKQPFSLLKFHEQAAKVAAPQMHQKHITFIGHIDPSLRDMSVVGDFNRLQQVVNNFLSNAFKFTPQNGTVELRTTHEGETVAGDVRIVTVRTCVKDSGPGIAHSDHGRVFQAWSQIRASDLQQGQGSGLGLSLCKAFVEAGHGGKIGFTSELGKGACFFFEVDLEVPAGIVAADSLVRNDTLVDSTEIGNVVNPRPSRKTGIRTRLEFAAPRVAHRVNGEPHPQESDVEMANMSTTIATLTSSSSPTIITRHEQQPPSSSQQPQPPQPPKLSNTQTPAACDVSKSVMLVDDSLVTRKLISKIFSALEVSFDTCENGQQIVDKVLVEGNSYQLILMDKEMPVMDGFDATRALRAGGYVFPIVGLTGNAMDDQVRDFICAGADEVYSKPIGRPVLVDVLTKYNIKTKCSADNAQQVELTSITPQI